MPGKNIFIPIAIAVVLVAVMFWVAYVFFIPKMATLPQSPPIISKPLTLEVAEPADGNIVNTAQIVISGKTKPEAIIAITSDADDVIVEPTSGGNFSTNFNLAEGENDITITAIDQVGNEKVEQRMVVYTTEQVE